MRIRGLGRVAAMLLCVFLLAGAVTPGVLAYSDPDEAFTIRITPPGNVTEESAAVEILVTDNAGDGFKRVQVRKGKNQTWQLITSDLDQRENRYYGSTIIYENCTVYVRVTDNKGKFHESSKYVDCFGTTEEPSVTPSSPPEANPDTTPRANNTFTPDGQASVLDNATSEDGKEFFTFSTPAENVFYLVIDKQRQDKNVYFLNSVTEKDLMALADTEDGTSSVSGNANDAAPEIRPDPVCTCKEKCRPGEIDASCAVCLMSWRNCKGEDHSLDGEEQAEQHTQPEKQATSQAGTAVFILLAVLAAGGAGYYFKIYKPRKEIEDAEDLDELTADGDEETITEGGSDEYDSPGAESGEQPDYGGYPESYGDGPEGPEDYES